MKKHEFRIAVIAILREMNAGINWPASEHSAYKIDALEKAVQKDQQERIAKDTQ